MGYGYVNFSFFILVSLWRDFVLTAWWYIDHTLPNKSNSEENPELLLVHCCYVRCGINKPCWLNSMPWCSSLLYAIGFQGSWLFLTLLHAYHTLARELNISVVKVFNIAVVEKKYGCIITHEPADAESCLPLLEDRGFLILIHSTLDKEHELESLTKKFTHSAGYNSSSVSVIVLRNSNINLQDKKVKKLMHRVKQRITEDLTVMKLKGDSVLSLIEELSKLKLSTHQPSS